MHTATSVHTRTRLLWGATAIALWVSVGLAAAEEAKVKLTGDQEVPLVTTSASGTGTITVGADKAVSGKVTTTGLSGVAAHIHEGAPGKSGPVIIPLTKGASNTWSVPTGAKLSDAQYDAYKAGNLYVNVHTAAHKDGEIRGQLKPPTLKSGRK